MDAIPGERWCARIKSPSVCGRLAPKFKKKKKKTERPKDSQLFLKWWLATQADAGIHSIAWENRSGAEHHFLTVKLFCRGGGKKTGLQLLQIKPVVSKNAPREGGKNSSLLRWSKSYARWTSPDRLLRPSVLSGCFLSSLRLHLRAVCKLRMNHRGALLCALRPATHTVPVILCSQAGPAGDAQPSSLKKKRKKKKKKIQSWPKLK